LELAKTDSDIDLLNEVRILNRVVARLHYKRSRL